MNVWRKALWNPIAAVAVLAMLASGCRGNRSAKAPADNGTAEPDKVLYDRALADIKKSRYTVGRLSLNTLINTYPDSEYLAKAKLAIADSYYKEGGTAGLLQSIPEYQDFITFFPFLDEAMYAQMQIGMAHYRMMLKPDRDPTQAEAAEDAFQTFLMKYPQSPLADKAAQRLREVQEIMAEGEYRVAHFYYIKGANKAALLRAQELAERYPLYSQSDKVLLMIGQLWERAAEQMKKNEDYHARDLKAAAEAYARLVRDYPMSPLVNDAKHRLTELGETIPQPDPDALARMQKEQQFSRSRPGFLSRSLGILRSGPDVSAAAHLGQPTLTPPPEPGGELLTPGGLPTIAPGVSTGGGGTSNVSVETVPPDSGSGPPPAVTGSSTTPPAPNTTGTGTTPPAGKEATSPTDPTAPNATAPGATGTTNPPGTTAAPNANGQGKQSGDKKQQKESTSKKKKKGLRKLIPW